MLDWLGYRRDFDGTLMQGRFKLKIWVERDSWKFADAHFAELQENSGIVLQKFGPGNYKEVYQKAQDFALLLLLRRENG